MRDESSHAAALATRTGPPRLEAVSGEAGDGGLWKPLRRSTFLAIPVRFHEIISAPAVGCRPYTPGNTSGSSSPSASWEYERPTGTHHISNTLAAQIQFESKTLGRTRSLSFLSWLLEPIDKPLDFRFFHTHRSVFHRGCPKGSVADQPAERCEGNAKTFGRLAAIDDSVSRFNGVGRWQAPLFLPAIPASLILCGRRIYFGYLLLCALLPESNARTNSGALLRYGPLRNRSSKD